MKTKSILILIFIFILSVHKSAQAFITASKSITFTFEIINIADYWGNVSGDKDNPYTITDSKGLDLIRKFLEIESNDIENKYFKQSGDIEYFGENNFIPIGTETKPFRANFDGANYKISGINYSGDAQYVGLFGYVEEGTIKNVRLDNSTFKSNYPDAVVGSIAGFISSDKIANCVVANGCVKALYGTAGGIVGNSESNAQIENCLCLSEDVTGLIQGALIGNNNGNVSLCYFTENFIDAIGNNTASLDNIAHAEKAYTLSLDKVDNLEVFEIVFSDDINLESLDIVQVDNDKIIYDGKIYAGASVDVTLIAIPEEYYAIISIEPQCIAHGNDEYLFLMPPENVIIKPLTGPLISDEITTIEILSLDLTLEEDFTDISFDENSLIEEITADGNSSIRTVKIRDNDKLTLLDLKYSGVEIVDVNGCKNLEAINLEGCKFLEYLDVSNTNIKTLNLLGCRNLKTLICASCDMIDLNIDGCDLLENVNFANNSLTRFDASMLKYLASLDHENQHVQISLHTKEFNILDILFISKDVDAGDVANIKDIEAFNENGEEIPVTYDDETGEIILSEEPTEIKYKYITGFKDVSMDVKISISNGGCNTGFMAVAFLIVLAIGQKLQWNKI